MTEETENVPQIISDTITDNLGRVIKLKEINVKNRVSFYRALGREDSINGAIVMEYWNVMAVDELDGQKQGTIKGIIDIEFMAKELEKSNASELIDKWLKSKRDEKERLNESGANTLKK